MRSGAGRSAEDARLAGPARDPVRVEALEEQLRRAPRGAEQVAEACERDRAGRLALSHEQAARLVVGGPREREPVADADGRAALLEEGGEPRVTDRHRLVTGRGERLL